MNESLWIGAGSAFWLGVLTSISPCPLATNIAAMSYVGKQVSSSTRIFLSGILYSLGRMLTYVILGSLLMTSIFSIPQFSFFLQKYMNKILGPILILTGMFLLDLLGRNFTGWGVNEKMRERAAGMGLAGAGLLGMLFALAFCPVSAALFFGGLLPLSLKIKSSIVLPSIYGAGTALPVLLFAILLMLGSQYMGKYFQRISRVEFYARRITGVVFILAGIYYVSAYIFKIF